MLELNCCCWKSYTAALPRACQGSWAWEVCIWTANAISRSGTHTHTCALKRAHTHTLDWFWTFEVRSAKGVADTWQRAYRVEQCSFLMKGCLQPFSVWGNAPCWHSKPRRFRLRFYNRPRISYNTSTNYWSSPLHARCRVREWRGKETAFSLATCFGTLLVLQASGDGDNLEKGKDGEVHFAIISVDISIFSLIYFWISASYCFILRPVIVRRPAALRCQSASCVVANARRAALARSVYIQIMGTCLTCV